jgi:hypothetical protein
MERKIPMLNSIILGFKKVFGKDTTCRLPSKDDCPFSHRFANIDNELEKIGSKLGELQQEIGKLLDRE